MSTLSNSPLLTSKQPKAPLPSPALLVLQEKGFELSNGRNDSISPPCVHEPLDQNQRISPFSLASTSCGKDQPLNVDTQVKNSRRSSSVGSAGTTVTKILNLYINVSDWSLQSEYEEITPYPDDVDEDAGPDIPSVHQPKAYRDTIAPLLEHQFSNYNLRVPAVDSLQSFVSLPKLLHPNANLSVASLHLEIDASSNTERKISDTSIQITPDISPPLPYTNYTSAPPSFQVYSQQLAQRKIALEVPDVRMTGPWYDRPVSPGPPKIQVDNRESYESAMTVISVDYERQMAYDALAPPITRKSPQMGPVSVVHDEILLKPSSAVVGDMIKQQMTPPPLNLSGMQSHSSSNANRLATEPAQKDCGRDQEATSIPYASANRSLHIFDPPDRGKARLDAAVDTKSNQSSVQVERPGSAFSSENEDSFVIHDTFRGHLKALWRHKFSKKEKDAKNVDHTQKGQPEPIKTSQSSPHFVDDPDSYRYPYKLPDGSDTLNPGHSTRANDYDDISSKIAGSLDQNQRPTPLSRDSRRWSPQQAIPLTRYQKYGPEIWYESKKVKHREERGAAKNSPTAESPAQMANSSALDRGEATDVVLNDLSQSRTISLPVTPRKMSPNDRNDTETRAKKPALKSRTSQNYNDSIFEASGGKKKSGFASRLLMSSEEKRKLKVKESILVVGTTRMSSGKQADRGSSSSVKPLVRI